ncbi:B3 domain-containing protein At4g34400-like [Syzygium oleosum]|uniref:B3 domain-containing protein At4g34400-like n=1 Tax=Syzygium oleosum TaxID=219896 RepID=UPI0024B9268C|nr:B3 domain-containing protein At4g34400-like [Syzygium oleosum]
MVQLDESLLGDILLTCPTEGLAWCVNAILEGGDIYFEDGWQNFVRDNLVKSFDVMVFRYQSQDVLRVVLYGDSWREKKRCSHPEEVGEEVEVKECNRDDDDNKEEEEDSECEKKECAYLEEVGQEYFIQVYNLEKDSQRMNQGVLRVILYGNSCRENKECAHPDEVREEVEVGERNGDDVDKKDKEEDFECERKECAHPEKVGQEVEVGECIGDAHDDEEEEDH